MEVLGSEAWLYIALAHHNLEPLQSGGVFHLLPVDEIKDNSLSLFALSLWGEALKHDNLRDPYRIDLDTILNKDVSPSVKSTTNDRHI